jgi:hypothetical protein
VRKAVVSIEDVPLKSMHSSVHSLANSWQWVSSEKLRALTGERERKSTIVEGIEEYRLAYEATMLAQGRARLGFKDNTATSWLTGLTTPARIITVFRLVVGMIVRTRSGNSR